ncbi:MAG TPA: hypothetical protein VE152_06445, partial [Acidimicrobiales bacterium]|nr:hypothetical protein [Acidimicrobiales bacterium]
GEAPTEEAPAGEAPTEEAPAEAGPAEAGASRPQDADALERLLAEEEEIERRTRESHHEAPHFRKETD